MPNTAPVITLTGSDVIVVAIGADFTDPGIDVSNNQPAYTGTVTTAITDSADATISEINTAIAGIYTITYTAPADTDRNTPATITRTVRVSIDFDNDNLIDIYTLDDLNAMRHNLDGTAYQATADGTELLCGTDAATACTGYELTRALDFDTPASYASGTVNPAWRPTGGDPDTATNAGWEPIGSCNDDSDADTNICGDSDDTPSTARFVGNGFTISNLYARNVQASGAGLGLFGLNGGAMEGIGIVDATIYGGGGSDFIGGLIGWNIATGTITDSYATGGDFDGGDGIDAIGGLIGVNRATITASYATGGDIDGGDGNDNVGGLVGTNIGGLVGTNNGYAAAITVSYATGSVNGGDDEDFVGGLVGANFGTITVSYATGSVNGGDDEDFVGGLVGANLATITASYATGDVDGGDDEDFVGGLVGNNSSFGTITASYATGDVDGGGGNEDRVGGLAGHNSPRATITASYATGNVDGGLGGDDAVGELVGNNVGTTASYGFGMQMGAVETAGVTRSTDASDAMAVTNACALTQANSSTTPANLWSTDNWDFGTTTQRPVVQDSGTIIAGQTNRDCN